MAKNDQHLIREIGRELRDDSSNLMRVQSARMPSVVASEAKIAEKAPAALRTLKELGGMDLVEMLGLTPYLEGTQ